jgi:two-component system response regulator YesN
VDLRFTEPLEQLLLGAIRQADEEKINSAVKTVLSQGADLKLPYRKFQIYQLEILRALLSLAESYNINWEDIIGENYSFDNIAEFDSPEEMMEYFTAISLRISAVIKRERQKSSSRLVDEAKEYIETNYSNCDLTVERMCDEFHVSPTYFSSLFKKETGNTVINYITECRMLAAKKLLLATELKTYIIAEKVGFQDANYFSFSFKKRFGLSPTKFRSENVE